MFLVKNLENETAKQINQMRKIILSVSYLVEVVFFSPEIYSAQVNNSVIMSIKFEDS